MPLVEIDHIEKGLDGIPTEQSKPNFEKWVSLYTREIQLVEDALLVLANQKDIDQAAGIWLDYIGKLVGETRQGRTDEQYRVALKIKIGINTSDGTPDVIIDLVRQYTESPSVRITEGTIAWASLYVNGVVSIDGSLYQLIQDIKAVGTRWIINSDVTDSAFQPAWEATEINAELFQTTDDGISYTDFQTTDDTITYENFFVSTGTSGFYFSSERSVPAWESETIEGFQVDTGVGVEDLEMDTGSGLELLDVVTSNIEPGTEIPLCWQVFADSTSPF